MSTDISNKKGSVGCPTYLGRLNSTQTQTSLLLGYSDDAKVQPFLKLTKNSL